MNNILQLSGIIFRHSLLYGAVLSAASTFLILSSLRWNAEIWLNDFPTDVRHAYGPPRNPQTLRQRRLVSAVFLFAILALLIASIIELRRLTGGLTFSAVFIHAFIMLMVFNLVDLVIIDWLALLALRPSWAILPGTEDLPGYRDWVFPLVGFFKGTVFIALISAIIAGIASLAAALV